MKVVKRLMIMPFVWLFVMVVIMFWQIDIICWIFTGNYKSNFREWFENDDEIGGFMDCLQAWAIK